MPLDVSGAPCRHPHQHKPCCSPRGLRYASLHMMPKCAVFHFLAPQMVAAVRSSTWSFSTLIVRRHCILLSLNGCSTVDEHLRHELVILPGFRDHHHHGLRQVSPGVHQQLQHSVKGAAVRLCARHQRQHLHETQTLKALLVPGAPVQHCKVQNDHAQLV